MATLPKYIIIQASGRGTRMGYLTQNQPKALITVHQQPLLSRVMNLYPQSHFIILGFYCFQVLKDFLTKHANQKQYTLIKTKGDQIGNNAGLIQALNNIPPKTTFMLLWCDLWHQKSLTHNLFQQTQPLIGLSSQQPCRYSFVNHQVIFKPTQKAGVMGVFIFPDKNIISQVPTTGEFCDFLIQQKVLFKSFIAKNILEVGTLTQYQEINHVSKQK